MKKNILVGFVVLALLTGFFLVFNKNSTKPQTVSNEPKSGQGKQISESQSAQIVSTKPDPLEGALVAGSDSFEITFSLPLENAPELKNMIEPKLEYKVELSQDKKTARFIPLKPYGLGLTYTIFIRPESKFEGGKRLDKEHIFHIHTIRYRGV